jgi:hypothetical protein
MEPKAENTYYSREARTTLYELVAQTGLPKSQIIAMALALLAEKMRGEK